MKILNRLLLPLVYILMAYIPFHALISTYINKFVGDKVITKGFKDAVIFILLPVAAVILIKSKQLLNRDARFVLKIILSYFLLCLTLALIFNANFLEELGGLTVALRYLAYFVICLASVFGLSKNSSTTALNGLVRIVVASSLVVILFGAAQVLFLPKDFLTIFDYGQDTIKPYLTIDNNESLIRILSTLRGPNPLGAYLAVVYPVALYYFSNLKSSRRWLYLLGYSLPFLLTLYGSNSRSGWLGLFISVIVYGFFIFKKKKQLILPLIAAGAIVLLGLFVFNDSTMVQKYIYHRDPLEVSSFDSDNQRIDSIKTAIRDINVKPFGHGVGSSGPASNYGQGLVIVENQFLDIAYQLGWLGMVVYLAIIGYVGFYLAKIKTKLAKAVFASFIAVNIISLFWPVWTDETVALTWWGLAGLIIGRNIVDKSNKR